MTTYPRSFPLQTKGKIFFGSCPFEEEFHTFKNLNIQVVWNLAAELDEIAKKAAESFKVIRTPIQDFSIPLNSKSFLEDVKTVYKELENNNIFTHCLGGRGRTSIGLAALSVIAENLTPADALKKTKKYCNGPETQEQRAFIIQLFL